MLNSKHLYDSKTQQILLEQVPETLSVFNDEIEHEKELINLLDEERLQYVGSMVLGIMLILIIIFPLQRIYLLKSGLEKWQALVYPLRQCLSL